MAWVSMGRLVNRFLFMACSAMGLTAWGSTSSLKSCAMIRVMSWASFFPLASSPFMICSMVRSATLATAPTSQIFG